MAESIKYIEDLLKVQHPLDASLFDGKESSEFALKGDLSNYYFKSETYNKDEIDDMIDLIKQFDVVVASELPEASADTTRKMYLISNGSDSDSDSMNIKDEYITLEKDGSYSWEKIGSMDLDLSGYATLEYVESDERVIASALTDLNTRIEDITDEISDINDIRTNASNGAQAYTNLGGHTVGVDVPSDAVFTDTIYDDTEISGRLDTAESDIEEIENDIETIDKVTASALADLDERLTNLDNSSFSGDYNDLTNKPEIPSIDGLATEEFVTTITDDIYDTLEEAENVTASALTDLDSRIGDIEDGVNTWNSKYTKPTSGIPASDLASGVQTSLSLANTALQSSDLENYYTTDQVDELVEAIKQFDVKVVDTLPEASESTMRTIYFVSNGDSDSEITNNYRDEYITLEKDGSYYWERIGSTDIDLSGYATLEYVEEDERVTAAALTDLNNRVGELENFVEEDPVFMASPAHNITSENISDWNGKQDTLVSGENIKTINGESILGEGNLSLTVNMLTEIIHSSLKTLRDNSQLIPGMQYRITDFVTTVSSDSGNARSANHPFDIIVVADDVNKLNENARAIQHSGDTYFNGCKLEAWELKYCLDNDSSMYYWADDNGKGVIYYMKDEWDNECPYDFKNVQYKRFKITSSSISDLVDTYLGMHCVGPDGCEFNVPEEAELDTEDFVWRYTFTLEGNDSTLNGENGVYSNKIEKTSGRGEYGKCAAGEYPEESGLYNRLNDIVFDGDNCLSNTFGDGCSNNTFGNGCQSNTFGNGFSYNIFGNGCSCNTFGDGCSNNTFKDRCCYNTFGDECGYNTFGDGCYYNTFGNACNINTFGNGCGLNTFGNYCESNTFGDECDLNTFGNGCSCNTFGTFGTESSSINYCRYIILDNGCSYLNIISSDTSATEDNFLQNIHIHLGVQRKTITVPDRNLPYEIEYKANNSQEIILD